MKREKKTRLTILHSEIFGGFKKEELRVLWARIRSA